MMDRADILAAFAAAANPAPVALGIKELPGAFVRVNTTGTQAEAAEKLKGFDDADGKGNARSLAVILCDESGSLLFDVKDPAQVDLLHSLRSAVSNRIFRVSNEVNRVRVDEDDPGKA